MITIALLLLLTQGSLQAVPQAPVVAPLVQDDYTIGVADVLNVTVFGEPDASRTGVTVDGDGTIDMPLIGRVKVGGRAPRAVEKEVRDRLAEKYLVNPSVSVEVTRYRSKSVTVQGMVRMPGEYVMDGNVSLTSALAKAGSMTLDAGSYVTISRQGAGGALETIRVSRKDIESGQAQNIMLRDADHVMVPKAETFFINGMVHAPGSYTWDEGLTVERALALAGGLTERASSRKISVDRNGKVKKVEKTDLVQANDTIRVGQRIF
jgi:polysaccharide biosynthesis/export protein